MGFGVGGAVPTSFSEPEPNDHDIRLFLSGGGIEDDVHS
jgi:hypothetical protein